MRIKITAILLFVFFVCSQEKSFCQNANMWAFGNRAGVNFNTTPASSFVSTIRVLEGCASVCDEEGQLLFYTDGTDIWNRNHDTMPNGRQINPIPDFSWSGEMVSSTFSTSQGVVIVPRPTFRGQYYVFSLTAWDCWEDGGKLYYSLVDMSLDGGRGDVVPNVKAVFLDSLLTERMSAVAGDRCNAWLTTVDQSLNFRSYEIDASGISNKPVLSPTVGVTLGMGGGCLTFSPKGDLVTLLYYSGEPRCAIYRFNSSTGEINTPVALFPESNQSAYGSCFSPDNTKLYVNALNDTIYQFDVSLKNPSDIIASRKSVCWYNGSSVLKRAPDGKIYFNGNNNRVNPALSAIPRPNLSAPACGYEKDILPLTVGTAPYIGLPNDVPDVNKAPEVSSQHIYVSCAVNDSIDMRAKDTSGWDYRWNSGSSAYAIKTSNPGVYFVTYYTRPCLFHIDTFRLMTFFPPEAVPEIVVTPNCKNTKDKGRILLFEQPASGFSPQYTWTNAKGDTLSTGDSLVNLASGKYLLQVTLAKGCDTTIVIEVSTLNQRLAFQTDSLICEGQSLVLENSSDGQFAHYSWDFGDGTLGNGGLVPSHLYTKAGRYLITIMGDANVCKDTFQQLVVVDAQVDSKFDIDRDSICAGEQIMAGVDNVATIKSRRWDWGDGNQSQTLYEESLHHAYALGGSFAINLTTEFRICPSVSYTRIAYVSELPVVDLGADTTLCAQEGAIRLKNLHSFKEGEAYRWHTGAITPELDVVVPGRYSLTVTNKSQCSTTGDIEVGKGCFIDIPNAFSPNGDGANDYFFPRQLLSDRVSSFKMQIFNRWGQLLFDAQKLEGRGWDGMWNNQPQDIGVYIYRIQVAFKNGQEEKYEGHVTLIK